MRPATDARVQEWPKSTAGPLFRGGETSDDEEQEGIGGSSTLRRAQKEPAGRAIHFPRRLLGMLRSEAITNPDVVRWAPDGKCFYIDNENYFVANVLPRYNFKASKIQSFQRNLNIYGFTKLTKGPYASGYVHKVFKRDIDDKELDEVVRDSAKGEPSPSSATSSPKKKRGHEESLHYDAGSSLESSFQRFSGGCPPRDKVMPCSSGGIYIGSPGRIVAERRMRHLTPEAIDNKKEDELALKATVPPPRAVWMMSPGTFWALPHASYLAGTSRATTSTVMAPQPIYDGTMDVLYIKRCKVRRTNGTPPRSSSSQKEVKSV